MLPLDPDPRSYLPQRIIRCPQCGDGDRVQVIIFGLPAFLPSAQERDRVLFGGCTLPPTTSEMPEWFCPTCDVSYTGRGEIVEELDDL